MKVGNRILKNIEKENMNYQYKVGDQILYDADGLHEAARWGIEEIAATIIGIASVMDNTNPRYIIDEKTVYGTYKTIPQNKIKKKI